MDAEIPLQILDYRPKRSRARHRVGERHREAMDTAHRLRTRDLGSWSRCDDTIVGPVRFRDSPVKNVSITSMAAGQWRKTKAGRFPFELVIVYNATAPQIPIEVELKLLSQLR